LIRPKMWMADDGNYRERRFFSSWKSFDKLDKYVLPDVLSIHAKDKQKTCDFGFGILKLNDCSVAEEICEELWSPDSPHIPLYLSGVDIICNSSGSHTQLRKLSSRLDLITNATKRCGGAYLYSNHRGCDGNRLYFDGCSMISVNGNITQQASQFSLLDMEVVVGTIDLSDIRTYRQGGNSLQEQSSLSFQKYPIPVVEVDFSLCDPHLKFLKTDSRIEAAIPEPEEECSVGPACWLWDYCRRSNQAGFLLPLSGGADSATVASIVYIMCRLVVLECKLNNQVVINDVKNLLSKCNITLELGSSGMKSGGGGNEPSSLSSPHSGITRDSPVRDAKAYKQIYTTEDITYGNISDKSLCEAILHTVYLGTDFSSNATTRRAGDIAKFIRSYHHPINIQNIVNAIIKTFELLTGRTPKFQIAGSTEGGTMTEDLALQNIQARSRMVVAYLCAQLFPWVRGRSKASLLVLGSANVDESLRGYLTKYDCSSADLNPIGAISKSDLKRTLIFLSEKCGLAVLREIVEAPPTAELRPIAGGSKDNYTQKDEDEMGMTYDELSVFGSFRKTYRCGPVSMFLKLVNIWMDERKLTAAEVAIKVKRFFFYYSINRHKMTTLTPSYHAESYSPCDNRFDLRPFLYNASWKRQNAVIDAIVASMAHTYVDVQNNDGR